jgi:uncharacterized membrane protein YidH (DUF202 family)
MKERIRLSLNGGGIISFVGFFLTVFSKGLATTSNMYAPNAVQYTTDENTQLLIRSLGLIIFSFGLLVIWAAYWHWLSYEQPDTTNSPDEATNPSV